MSYKKEVIVLFGILFIIISFLIIYKPSIIGYVTSSVSVPNSPPNLVTNIPDQTWSVDTINNDAFDLDDYFSDPNLDPLAYTVVGNSSIIVDITSLTNMVSFSQPAGWTGTEHVIFSATDDNGESVESNSVSLTVTSAPTPAPTGEAVGGGGGAPKKIIFPNFDVTPEIIKEKLKQGEIKSQTITIENTGELPLEFVIDATEVKSFVILSDYAFYLPPKQKKEVTVVLITSTTTKPDVYTGRIFVKTKDLVKPIIVILEAESIRPVFDVNMSIPAEYKNILAGKSVVGDIVVVNLGDILPVDVTIEYVIKNMNNEIIDIKTETLAVVKDKLSITKSIETPEDIALGDYIFYVKVTYNENVSTASDLFSVISTKEKLLGLTQRLILIILIVLIILIIVGIIFINYRKRVEHYRKRRSLIKAIKEVRKNLVKR